MRNIFIALLSLTLFVAAAGAQSFQVVGFGGNLTVQSSGALSTSTDSGFTTYIPIQSVKYKGTYSGVFEASAQLTTGALISGTQEQSAQFAQGGSVFVNGSGALDGTPAAKFTLTGVFSGHQTWLSTNNGHVLIAVVLGRIAGETRNHSYSLILITTNHGFAGNGYVDVVSCSIVRFN